MSSRRWVEITILIAAAGLALLAARSVLLLITGDRFPVSEDAAGHLYKAVLLLESLRAGQGIPDLFPGWYAGSESFRYWPHLPYFLLAVPLAVGADPGLAALVVSLAGLGAGGLGVLLWRRRLGWPLAIAGAVLAALLADPVRVAFTEGNLPRVVAHALFLPTLAAAIAVTDADRWHPWRPRAALLVALVALTVLCHAMMAAAAAVAIMLVLICRRIAGRGSWERVQVVGGLIVLGIALSGWWLIPSLGGGIVGTSGEAVRRGLLHFHPVAALDPLAPTDLVTSSGRASFYVGLALAIAAVVALIHGGRRGSGWPYLVSGLALIVIALDPLALLYIRLPFANLLWPVRLQSVGQVLILLGLLHAAADVLRASAPSPGRRAALVRPAMVGLLLAAIALDGVGNLTLIQGRPIPAALEDARVRMVAEPGWRVAALDLSRLGSAPTLLWREREQLYGWGIQGARNIVEIVDLNESIERRLTGTVVSRLDWWGVDHAILDREDADLEPALGRRGYVRRDGQGPLRHWARPGEPRALVLAEGVAAGIGRNARIWSMLFPQVIRTPSEFVDDHDPAELRRFQTLVLALPRWRDRERAEGLIRDYVAGGGRVLIELSGSRQEVTEDRSRFLGVEAVRTAFPAEDLDIRTPEGAIRLLPFDRSEGPWLASRYSGALDARGTVTLPDQAKDSAVVVGVAQRSERIVFLGLNLAFHALLTGDEAALRLIERLTGLDREAKPVHSTIPLRRYEPSGSGYRLALDLEREGRIVVPLARHERMTTWVNGTPWPTGTLNDAVTLDLPAGAHEIRITVESGGARLIGWASSGAALLVLLGLLLVRRRGNPPRMLPIVRAASWSIAPQEIQRTDRLAIGEAAGRGPFAVVLAQATNLGRAPAAFDPQLVALVDRHGRPLPLALPESHALGRTLDGLRPGEAADPAIVHLITLVYQAGRTSGPLELVARSQIRTDPGP